MTAAYYEQSSSTSSTTTNQNKTMAISNELSSEIVIALIEKTEGSPERMNALKDILLEVHSTLQSLSEAERRARERERPTLTRKAGFNQG